MINKVLLFNKNINFKSSESDNFQEKRRLAQERFVDRANKLTSDVDKILALEDIRKNKKPFVIIDKKLSKAYVIDNKQIIDVLKVGVGKTYGDDLNEVDIVDGELGSEHVTTPSGLFYTKLPEEFIISNKNDYKSDGHYNLFVLKGVQHPIDYQYNTSLAFHQLPNDKEQERLQTFYQKGRRGISTGCINFRKEDFEKLEKEISPNDTPVYILPEEPQNSLEVVSMPNGLWMKTKYGSPEKENIYRKAIKKFFNIEK